MKFMWLYKYARMILNDMCNLFPLIVLFTLFGEVVIDEAVTDRM